MYMTTLDKIPWFPNHDVQVGVTVAYLFALSIMTFMLTARFPPLQSVRNIATWSMPYPYVTMLIALFASWCYIFISGILNLGVGLSTNLSECSRGLFLCTWFYTTTKLGLYLFLMERAFVVRGGGVRFKSWHYRFNFILVVIWLAIFIMLETGRVYALRDDGVCTFGWEYWALIPLMVLDVFVNAYILATLVIPLFKNQFTNPRLRVIATKSLIATLGSVCATIANLVMLIMIHAPGWLCLGSCSLDIFANAMLLFYITRTLETDINQVKATWTQAQYDRAAPVMVVSEGAKDVETGEKTGVVTAAAL